MKKIFFTILAMLAGQLMALNVFASNPNSVTVTIGQSTATDADGNVYVSGPFTSTTLAFGTFTLTKSNCPSDKTNMFIVKYDPGGNVLWATSAGGIGGNEYPLGLATDAAGNVYVACDTPFPPTTFYSATSSGPTITMNNMSMVIIKYDPSGNLLWVQGITGAVSQWQGLAVDEVGGNEYVYLTGSYSSTATFGSTTLTSAGMADVFVAKYDANGTAIWAVGAGGSNTDLGTAIATDGSGNIFITGHFNSPSITFGNFTLSNGGLTDVFIVKYNPDGTVAWAESAGGTGYEFPKYVATDYNGNVYITGYFRSPSITFGTYTLNNYYTPGPHGSWGSYLFIVKYDPAGNVLWAQTANASAPGQGVATDASGNVFLTGYFASPLTFGTTTLSCQGSNDIYLVKYTANGNVIWAESNGGAKSDLPHAITTDASGNILVTGFFMSSTITFGTTTLNISYSGDQDMFIAKYDPNGNSIWANSAGAAPSGGGGGGGGGHGKPKSAIAGSNDRLSDEITIYPNPTTGMITMSTADSQPGIINISVFTLAGKEVSEQKFSAGNRETILDLSSQPKGCYLIRIKTGENLYLEKIIIE